MRIDSDTLYALLLEGWNSGEIESAPRSYSGRGMFGKRCIAVETSSNTDPFEIGYVIGQLAGLGGIQERAPRANMDSLGLGSIVYWPECEWDENAMEDKN